MEATLLLADYAVVQDGKLNMLGAGWTVAGNNAPFAIAVIVHVPWSETNIKHTWQLQLFDEDMNEVVDENGNAAARLAGEFEAGRPAGLPPGVTVDVLQALNFAPMPLPPGRRWEWRLMVDDVTVANRTFSTRPEGA